MWPNDTFPFQLQGTGNPSAPPPYEKLSLLEGKEDQSWEISISGKLISKKDLQSDFFSVPLKEAQPTHGLTPSLELPLSKQISQHVHMGLIKKEKQIYVMMTPTFTFLEEILPDSTLLKRDR